MRPPDAPGPRVIRFGKFAVDLRSGELSVDGSQRHITLPDQPLRILDALLERPGELVTRDELRQRVWSTDTFVDFEHGLNAAVKRLRDVLGDSADDVRFIETVPRRGYRFIAPVSVVNGGPPAASQGVMPAVAPERPVSTASPAATDQPQQLAHELITRSASRPRVYAGLGLGAGALLGAAMLAGGGDLRLVGAATGGVLGAVIGHGLGTTRAASMRLQAIAVLDQSGQPR